jgi:hypothetical protein
VHAHTAAKNRVLDHAARKDAAARHDGIDSLSAAVLLVEGELGGRIGVGRGAQWRLPVIEVERGTEAPQVHVGFVIGVDRPHVAPVRQVAGGLAGNPVGLEIVGENRGLAGHVRAISD